MELRREQSGFLAGHAMTSHQWAVVAIMLVLNMTDGFDILAISFAGPGIANELHLSATRLGLLFSSGFVGTAIGSLLLAPFADRLGRKPILVACLAMLAGGMLMSAAGHSLGLLLTSRVVTGFGAGALLPVINAVVAEFSSDRRRGLAISVAQLGFAIGGLAGGLLSAMFFAHLTWRSIFVAGASFSALCLVVVIAAVPESPDVLLKRRRQDALDETNRVLAMLHHDQILGLPDEDLPERRAAAFQVLTKPLQATTVRMALSYIFTMGGYYAFINWLPRLQVMAGVAPSTAAFAVTIATAGSIAGGLGYGLLVNLVGSRRLTFLYFLIGAAGGAVVASATPAAAGVEVGSFLFGMAIGGGITGLFALLAAFYPAGLRTTASGLAIGAGRGGAMIGPLLCGIALDAGVTAPVILGLTGASLLLAAAALPPVRPMARRDNRAAKLSL